MVGTPHRLAARNAAENLLALSGAFGGWSSRQDGYVIADAGSRGCRAVVTCPPAGPDAAIGQMIGLAREHLPGSGFLVEDTLGALPLEQHGFVPLARVPVMARPPEAARDAVVADRPGPGAQAHLRVLTI